MRSHSIMLPVFLLACHLLPMASLQGGEPASEADVNFATEALKVFSDYDEEKLLKFVGERNPEFSDLRPYMAGLFMVWSPSKVSFLAMLPKGNGTCMWSAMSAIGFRLVVTGTIIC
jgi:hypothetical protein